MEHTNIDGEHDSIIGSASVNGQAVYFIDVDGQDNEFELMVTDANGNQQIDEGEVVDISDQHMSVSHLRKWLKPTILAIQTMMIRQFSIMQTMKIYQIM